MRQDDHRAAPEPSAAIAQLPNALSVLRIALAIALPFVPAFLRLPIVVVAAASDGLDGWVARRYAVTSLLGSFLDGIADKLFVLSTLVTLVAVDAIEPWQALVVLARDITVAALAGWGLLRREWGGLRSMRPRLAGKLTTVLLLTWVIALLAGVDDTPVAVLFAATAAASGLAALDYLDRLRRALQARRAAR